MSAATDCHLPVSCGYVPGEELRQHWDARYVALSLALSGAGAFTSLTITQHLKHCSARWRYVAFVVAAGFGLGINTVWSMHFVGMKALTLAGGMASGAQGTIAVRFEIVLTIISAVAAWAFASVGLHIMAGWHVEEHGRKISCELVMRLAMAALLIAGGVCVMHFFGMVSQTGFFAMAYDPGIVVLSTVVAVVAASAGLFILFLFPNTLAVDLVSACLIAGAVNGMHYCGMASATYTVKAEEHAVGPARVFDLDGIHVALFTLFADLGLYVVCNHYGESLRRVLEADRQRAMGEVSMHEAMYRSTKEKQQAMEQARTEQALKLKIAEAVASVKELGHPMIVIPAQSFLKLRLEEVGTSHEGYREWGKLKILDNMMDAKAFKESGGIIVFFSYECLAYKKAGPDGVQLAAMKASVQEIAAARKADVSSVYVWLDCLSIPQRNAALKKAAINSIYTFASIPDFMVIICPESVHADTSQKADSESLKRRLWCRTEQLAYCCSQGTETMYLHRGRLLEPLPDAWMDSVCCVHDADTTCCRLKHSAFPQCDRETAVLPLLALYYDVYSRLVSGSENDSSKDACAWTLISRHRSQMFPQHYEYGSESGMERRDLFGDLIERVEEHVDRGTPGSPGWAATREGHGTSGWEPGPPARSTPSLCISCQRSEESLRLMGRPPDPSWAFSTAHAAAAGAGDRDVEKGAPPRGMSEEVVSEATVQPMFSGPCGESRRAATARHPEVPHLA